MPRVSKLSLPPIDWGKESIGQRIARLRLTTEMAVRFAMALNVTLDELPHPNAAEASTRKPSRKVLRRLEKIEDLPPTQQTTLLRTIDTFLEVAALQTARRA